MQKVGGTLNNAYYLIKTKSLVNKKHSKNNE